MKTTTNTTTIHTTNPNDAIRTTQIHGITNTYQGNIYIAGVFRGIYNNRIHLKVSFVSNPDFAHLLNNEHNFSFVSFGLFDCE